MISHFRRIALTDPDTEVFTFFDGNGQRQSVLSRGVLCQRADALASALASKGLTAGDRVVLCYPPSMDFIVALFACLSMGVVPVPVYPPSPHRLAHDLTSLRRVVDIADAKKILTNRSYRWVKRAASLRHLTSWSRSRWSALEWVATDGLADTFRTHVPHEPDPSDVAFLQFTSGSTSEPKGVRITWENLRHQLEFNRHQLGFSPDARLVMWVPQYHDLGLISGILSVLNGNGWLGMLSPLAFLRRPAVWFDVMSQARATHTAAPDFAYALAVRRTTAEQRAGWDLSHLRVAMNAAEPVRATTMRAFVDAFRVSGLSPESWSPAYGLAEHTVGVTLGGGRVLPVQREQLAHHGRLVRQQGSDLEMVSCGRPPADIIVRVVDPESGRALPAGQIGEIWVDSPSKADGYEGRPDLSQATFEAALPGEPHRFLRTGDMGALVDGELYVTGRRKDMFIVGGHNLYPHDIEDSVRACHPSIRPGGVAVFSGAEEAQAEERLVALVELREYPAPPEVVDALVAEVRRVIQARHDIACHGVVIGQRGAVLKTTSGKVRRRACREAFLAETLPVVHVDLRQAQATPWLQACSRCPVETQDLRALEPAIRASLIEDHIRDVLASQGRDPTSTSTVDWDTTLQELGFDSVQRSELLVALEDRYAIPLSLPEHRQGNMTPRELCQGIEEALCREPTEEPPTDHPVVGHDPCTSPAPQPSAGDDTGVRTALLTGITGNLGALMAWRLLQDGCRVYALSRRRGLPARERALQALRVVSGQPISASHALARRLIVIDVPITDDDAMCAISIPEGIDETWHFASTVKFMPKDRDEIYEVNLRALESTLALHRRAARTGAKFWYVSTAYIAGKGQSLLPEARFGFEHIKSFHNDYERSKYQAESLFFDALEAGHVEGCVVRPSIVVDARPPMSLKNYHGYYVLVQSLFNFNAYLARRDESVCLRLQMDESNLVNLIPLDVTAERMMMLRAADPVSGGVFHVTNGSDVTIGRVWESLSEDLSHLSITFVDREAFTKKRKGPYESLFAYNTVYTAPYCHEKLRFDQTATQALLGNCFELDYTADRLRALNHRYLRKMNLWRET